MWVEVHKNGVRLSRYTYRCVVLPDRERVHLYALPRLSQCTYRCAVLPDGLARLRPSRPVSLNAPTGAWCSLTLTWRDRQPLSWRVSMHLQVRGAP